MIPSDTHPDIERRQIEWFREASAAEKVARSRALTATAIAASRRAVAEANPQLLPREALLLWIQLHYGETLAAQLRQLDGDNP